MQIDHSTLPTPYARTDRGTRQQYSHHNTEKCIALLTAHRELKPQALVKRARKEVSSFAGDAAQSDDITMLAAAIG